MEVGHEHVVGRDADVEFVDVLVRELGARVAREAPLVLADEVARLGAALRVVVVHRVHLRPVLALALPVAQRRQRRGDQEGPAHALARAQVLQERDGLKAEAVEVGREVGGK